MTAPMMVIELIVMRAMYHDMRRNALIIGASILAGVLFIVAIRQQIAGSDRQFLRSMIPHHRAAILMCEQAPIQDPETRALCRTIMTNQQAEIDPMRAKLAQLVER